jgi:lipoprotein-anchoring transpeptidase ErfK/SrfK
VNTLKSGTTIVVLLGVLYGVYIVLSKPDRLAHLQLPGSKSAKVGPGPAIDFGGAAPTEPHLAVETGTPHDHGHAHESGSPASPAVVAPPLAIAPSSAPTSAYGVATPPASPPASAGNGSSAYGASAYAPASGSVSSGSSYNVSSGATNSASDLGPASAYGGRNAGTANAMNAPESTAYGASPVQPAYGANTSAVGQVTPVSLNDTSAQVQSSALTDYSIRQMWASAEQLVAASKFREALSVLSEHYGHASLPSEHREAMAPWLDALAARVIYSKQHLLELPYEARAKETLFDIQDRFNVPWQLLQNINHDVVSDPSVVVVGTQLKVVQGPFRAVVETSRGELVVYLNNLYAGRFSFTLGNEAPKPGQFKVSDKRTDRVYYGTDGRTIPASDPTNPYGGYWLDLGREVSIHGSPIQGAATETLGSISLSPQDAKDVYSILSVGSEVLVR